MLFRRIKVHIEKENWFAVFIDFLIVVIGVFIGIQVANWNDERQSKDGTINTLYRLQEEVKVNLASLNRHIERIEEKSDIRTAAVNVLATCDESDKAKTTLLQAIDGLIDDIIPSFINNSSKELARQDRYLRLLSEDFRTALNLYDSRLTEEAEQLTLNFELMWAQHVITHPSVGVQLTTNSDDPFSAIEMPVSSLCKDNVFTRQFVLTIAWHRSIQSRLQRFKEQSEEFLEILNKELSTR